MSVMAKTWKDIDYDRMVSMQRIERAVWNAGKDKRQTVSYIKYSQDLKKQVALHRDLVSGEYRHKMTSDKEIFDPKAGKFRTIRRPCFRDQIVHHLLVLELEPYMKRHIIQHNIACIPKRGNEYGRVLVKQWTRSPKRQTRWVVQGDVSKYYENAQSDILMGFFKRKVRDKRVLGLLQQICDTYTDGFVLGYYISQWFGAIYLASLDNMVKHELRIKHYIRYVDNIVLAVSTKKQAYHALGRIQAHLKGLGLTLKCEGRECHRVYKWAEQPIDFIGYRTHRDGFQEMRKSTYLRIRRSVCRVMKMGSCSLSQARSMLSRRGVALKTDCNNVNIAVDSVIKHFRMRRIVSYASKQKMQRLAC
jgi:RNA-directed DNA polymerase